MAEVLDVEKTCRPRRWQQGGFCWQPAVHRTILSLNSSLARLLSTRDGGLAAAECQAKLSQNARINTSRPPRWFLSFWFCLALNVRANFELTFIGVENYQLRRINMSCRLAEEPTNGLMDLLERFGRLGVVFSCRRIMPNQEDDTGKTFSKFLDFSILTFNTLTTAKCRYVVRLRAKASALR